MSDVLRRSDGAVDGRAARAQLTRDAVVDALLAMHDEGDLAPTAQRVAERAGVALRTVYGHFSDMEGLYAASSERVFERVIAMGPEIPPGLPTAARVDAFCARRSVMLEALLPAFRASRVRMPFSRTLRRTRQRFIAYGDAELEALFRDVLAAAPDRQRLLDALHAATTAATWDVLRDDRGLDPAAAERVMRLTVAALVGAVVAQPVP